MIHYYYFVTCENFLCPLINFALYNKKVNPFYFISEDKLDLCVHIKNLNPHSNRMTVNFGKFWCISYSLDFAPSSFLLILCFLLIFKFFALLPRGSHGVQTAESQSKITNNYLFLSHFLGKFFRSHYFYRST